MDSENSENSENCVNCHNVSVRQSTVCEGHGVFANKDFSEGEVVETGIAKVLNNCDGHENPVLFTWSDQIPNKTWATCSGCAPFYNSTKTPNCQMERDFVNNTFMIKAVCPIKKGEELFHTYRSLEWRECFSDIKNL